MITTIVKMRAPGMTLMKMPMFTWTALVANVIIVSAFPVFDDSFGNGNNGPSIWNKLLYDQQMAVWICFGRTCSGFGDILKYIS